MMPAASMSEGSSAPSSRVSTMIYISDAAGVLTFEMCVSSPPPALRVE